MFVILRLPGLPKTVHVDTCHPGIVNRTSFYIQNCPGLDDKLYDYLSICMCHNPDKLRSETYSD